MNLAAILCLQEQRKVHNDYTIRLNNQVYQVLPPAYPGLNRSGALLRCPILSKASNNLPRMVRGVHPPITPGGPFA